MENHFPDQIIEEQINELGKHRSIQKIEEAGPMSYNISYCPQSGKIPFSKNSYRIKLTLPERFPEEPPWLIFLDKLYHLNVHPETGKVIMPILGQDWSPFISLCNVFESLQSILDQPDPNSGATKQLLRQFISNREQYDNMFCKSFGVSKELINKDQGYQVIQIEPNEHSETIEEINVEDITFKNKSDRGSKLCYQNAPPQLKIFDQLSSNVDGSQNYQSGSNPNNDKWMGDGFSMEQEGSQTLFKTPKSDSKLQGKLRNVDVHRDAAGISKTLGRINQTIEIFMKEYHDLEHQMQATKNEKLRRILDEKIVKQVEMIEELYSASAQIKQKIMKELKAQVNGFLK